MSSIWEKVTEKFFLKSWIIGICHCDIRDIIRNRTFDPEINWLKTGAINKSSADPFLLSAGSEGYRILYESFSEKDKCGTIWMMKLDGKYRVTERKMILDTRSHLSYPLTCAEGGRIYLFPEASRSGKLSCYQYDDSSETVTFVTDVIDLPLLDATILKSNGRYWIFGAIWTEKSGYQLHLFFSGNLLGPYKAHLANPVRTGMNGTRSAGNFISVDGMIYRPAQNCEEDYGKSITIYRILELTETTLVEEPHMDIRLDSGPGSYSGLHSVHTINTLGNTMVVDGINWKLAPVRGLKNYLVKRVKSGA